MDASDHCGKVRDHIGALIESAPTDATNQQSISFADFMRAALYAPGLGYYTAGATKLGHGGDFVTAPELSSFFGAALADAFRPMAPRQVLELGAGTGKLAEDFLAAFSERDSVPRYEILEVSADLRQRQEERLRKRNVAWHEAVPERIDGLVLANEVLDAVPCEIVRYAAGRYEQGRVARAAAGDNGFAWHWHPLSDGPLFDAARARIPPMEGYTTEVNLEAEALVATLAERLSGDGAICFIDYGFPRRGYYVDDRAAGTLACHFQHRAHFDPLILPGLQDITAHVDFTAMAEAAVDAGAGVICYATQAQFLLAADMLSRLQAHDFATDVERFAATGAIQKLLAPSEMGELFKVLVVGKAGAVDRLQNLARIDQSYRL